MLWSEAVYHFSRADENYFGGAYRYIKVDNTENFWLESRADLIHPKFITKLFKSNSFFIIHIIG
jgi:hypothetical protein